MVPTFYVKYCLIFSPYKDKIDDFYASIKAYFNTGDDGDLNKYLRIELEHS